MRAAAQRRAKPIETVRSLLSPAFSKPAINCTAAAAALDVDDEDSKKANIVAARAARVRLAGDDKYFCKPLMVR